MQTSVPQSFRNGLIILHEIDKATWANLKWDTLTISYVHQSIQKRQESGKFKEKEQLMKPLAAVVHLITNKIWFACL